MDQKFEGCTVGPISRKSKPVSMCLWTTLTFFPKNLASEASSLAQRTTGRNCTRLTTFWCERVQVLTADIASNSSSRCRFGKETGLLMKNVTVGYLLLNISLPRSITMWNAMLGDWNIPKVLLKQDFNQICGKPAVTNLCGVNEARNATELSVCLGLRVLTSCSESTGVKILPFYLQLSHKGLRQSRAHLLVRGLKRSETMCEAERVKFCTGCATRLHECV